jgi:hypothetical protein
MHCTENPIYVFPEMKLQKKRQTDLGNIHINRSQIHECGNWETEHYNSVLEITSPHFWEYINQNQTFTVNWSLNGPSLAVCHWKGV